MCQCDDMTLILTGRIFRISFCQREVDDHFMPVKSSRFNGFNLHFDIVYDTDCKWWNSGCKPIYSKRIAAYGKQYGANAGIFAKKMRKVSKWCFFTTSSLTWFQNITSTFLYDTATIPSNKAQHKPRKQCLPYTRSLLRPILVHTSPNARPIKGIGQAGHKDGFNMGAITGRASTC